MTFPSVHCKVYISVDTRVALLCMMIGTISKIVCCSHYALATVSQPHLSLWWRAAYFQPTILLHPVPCHPMSNKPQTSACLAFRHHFTLTTQALHALCLLSICNSHLKYQCKQCSCRLLIIIYFSFCVVRVTIEITTT